MAPSGTNGTTCWWRAARLLLDPKGSPGLPLLFLLTISLPLADMVFTISKPVDIKENRRLAAKPQFDLRQPWAYLNEYEAYFNDHFAFRTQMLRIHNRLIFRLFRVSPTTKVVIGRRGWLFIAGDTVKSNEIDYYRALKPFSLQELHGFKKVLEQRRDWLARRGIRYLFMLAPNKSTIYPEYMPATYNKVHARSRMDQLFGYLSRHSSVEVLDLRPALLREKHQRRIYQKTDSHWNDLGGYVAYSEVMRRLEEYFPGVRAMPLSDFEVDQHSSLGGDLAAMLTLQHDLFRETRITIKPKVPFQARTAAPTPGFSPKASWIRIQATECPDGQIPAAVMVRDSFAHQLLPFLSETFARIVYIWDWDLHFFLGVIEKEKPQIVIDQMVERALSKPIPVNPGELQRP